MLKVLASVRQMIHSGNRVVFDLDGSFIEHKPTGKRTEMVEKNGNFVFQIRVPKRDKAGFQRQVAVIQSLSEQI